jgi:hypothetical protein
MPISLARAAHTERPIQGRASSDVMALGDQSKVMALARQLCVELQALTGNANASVLLDILMKRLRVGPRELEAALAAGVAAGWVERRGDTVALREEGRQATLMPWPPREPMRAQSRFR